MADGLPLNVKITEYEGKNIMHDPVNAPKHYRAGGTYETIRVIEAWGLGFNLGNTVKYISRCGKKNNHLQDLEKARWYLDREIANIKAKAAEPEVDDPAGQEGRV